MKQLFERRFFSLGLFYFIMEMSVLTNWIKERFFEVCYPVDDRTNMVCLNRALFLLRDDLYRDFISNIRRNQSNHITPSKL